MEVVPGERVDETTFQTSDGYRLEWKDESWTDGDLKFFGTLKTGPIELSDSTIVKWNDEETKDKFTFTIGQMKLIVTKSLYASGELMDLIGVDQKEPQSQDPS